MKNPKRRRSTKERKDVTADLNCTKKYIPADVTAEILSRLPIKSIGRFTSVSKSWRDLITSRTFSSMHSKNYPFSTFYATSYYFDWRREGHNMVEVHATGKYFRTTLRPSVRGLSESSRMTQIVGSCNGLLCLLEHRHDVEVISILNPITNESTVITLPNHADWIDGLYREEDVARRHYAFGYSPSTNEYKVLKGLGIVHGAEVRSSYAIFTVGVDGRWRDLPHPHLFPNTVKYWDADNVVLCNGAFHWLVVLSRDNDPRNHYIISFDIARESARRIPTPHHRNIWYLKLLSLNNRLCLCRSYLQRDQVKTIIWKMEEYGNDDCWSQITALEFSFCVYRDADNYDGDIFAPVNYATKYGSILFRGNKTGNLRLYRPKQKRHTAIRVPYATAMMLFFEFIPTFLSIDEIVHGKSSNNTSHV